MNIYEEEARALRPIVEKAMTTGELTPEEMETATILFPKWNGESVTYPVGALVSYNNILYRCVQEHVSQAGWNPVDAASLWARTSDPSEEWPEWIQPTGGHDSYKAGDKVSHNGKHWVSDVDNNVWEPGAYGWTEQ